MAGFMSGFGQGFSQLPSLMQRNEERELRERAQLRADKIEQRKATGDIISGLGTALETTPEEAIPNRLNLFFAQIEQNTGKKIAPSVKAEFVRDPLGAVKSMSQVYGESGGFDQQKLGDVLSDPAAFAGIYDALNKRQAAKTASAAFSTGVGAEDQGGSGSDPQKAIQQALIGMAKMDPATPGFKERLAALQSRAEQLSKREEFGLSNPIALMGKQYGVDVTRAHPEIMQFLQQKLIAQGGAVKGAETAGQRKETVIPLEAAQLTQQPIGTTYGQLEGGAAPPAAAGAPGQTLGQRNNNPGNLRPVGASTGFQKFSTMQEGLAALDKDLQIKGARGVNTIRKIISAWAPPNENDTEAYISTVAKRLGLPADAALDMESPLVRQALGTAIALHENGPKAFLAPNQGRGGQGGAAAPGQASLVPPSAADVAQQREMSVGVAQEFRQYQKDSVKAAARQRNAETLSQYLEKVDTGALAGNILQVQRLAAAAGFPIPESASYAEAARALSLAMAQEMRDPSQGAGSPGAISDFEGKTFQQMVPNIDKLPGANRLIAKGYIENQKRAQEIAKRQREYVKNNGGKVDDGIYEIAEKYRAENPLFTQDDINKVLKGETKSAQGKGPVAAAIEPFKDSGKEARYQAWKKSQGK